MTDIVQIILNLRDQQYKLGKGCHLGKKSSFSSIRMIPVFQKDLLRQKQITGSLVCGSFELRPCPCSCLGSSMEMLCQSLLLQGYLSTSLSSLQLGIPWQPPIYLLTRPDLAQLPGSDKISQGLLPSDKLRMYLNIIIIRIMYQNIF